jgi:hypothetical protein
MDKTEIYGLTFLVANLVMISGGFWAGWKFWKQYRNYLLAIEWFIIASSGVNFLIWGARFSGDEKAGKESLQYLLAFFLDAFSRSVGITLLLIVGLMAVTHHYKSSIKVDIGILALAIAGGIFLGHPRYHEHVDEAGNFVRHDVPATIYLVANLLTLIFLVYFAKRLWDIGAKRVASATLAVSLAGTAIALMYDFFPLPDSIDPLGDRALFYTLALTVWGCQLFTYLFAYRTLHDHNQATAEQQPSPAHPVPEKS